MKHSQIIATIAKQNGKEPKNKELAQILGLSMDGIRSRAFRDKEYSYEDVQKIADFYKVNFSDNDLEQIKSSLITKRIDYLNQINEFEADLYTGVFGSCGGGTFVLSEDKEKINIPKKIVKNYSPVKKYSVINAYGDSMEPNIQDGDLLIVEHCENEQIIDNRVYVFCFEDKIFVKRLILNINQLIIKSDNSMYQPITLLEQDLNSVQIIGQIVGLMRTKV